LQATKTYLLTLKVLQGVGLLKGNTAGKTVGAITKMKTLLYIDSTPIFALSLLQAKLGDF
jgi:hypothetical protein